METKDFVLGFAAGKAQGGGGGEPTGTIQITANGNHNVKQYATAAVNVPNSYSASDEGKVVNNGALVAQTTHSEITENGTYDTTLNDEVTVNVQGGATAQRSGIFGSPYIAMTPQTVSKSGIVEIEAPISGEVEETNVISSGILGNDSIGHKVLFALSGTPEDLAKTIEINGFTEIVSLNNIRVYWGILNANTAFRHNDWFLCSAIEIEDDYSAVPVTDYCMNLTEAVNTSYLKVSSSFRINAKLPSGYGIFVTSTNYDYSDSSYRPAIWELASIAVAKPMITIRRKDGAGNSRTGFACFLKMDTDEYNQAFIRGSVSSKDYTSGVLQSAPSAMSSYNSFKDVPGWNAWSNFSIAYIKLEKSQT